MTLTVTRPKKRTLITGITGQDGSYLAELLLEEGCEVHGVIRRVAAESSDARLSRIKHIAPRLHLHHATLESYPSLAAVISEVQPDELYHLAAQSYVTTSFEDSFSTMQQNVDGTHYVLAAVRRWCPDCRVYFAGSSEMFGNAPAPQDEATPFMPRSPYGTSKLAGYHLVRNYREAHGLWACTGILFNHESPRRGHDFVTRKVTRAVAAINVGRENIVRLGDLDARRDWGYAGDYVKAMRLMLRKCAAPRDYVVATGESHSVRDLCEVAFSWAGLDYRAHVVVDPGLMRPAEIHELRGDASAARRELGWEPTVGFSTMVRMMVNHDLKEARL